MKATRPERPIAPPLLERLDGLLEGLGMPQAQTQLLAHLERATQEKSTYADFLLRLLEAEQNYRTLRVMQTRMRMAGIPTTKTLADFDFSFQPSIDERQIRELQTLRFVQEAQNVIFLGPPGVGKTHLSISLCVEAIRGGFSAYFATAYDLVADLGQAAREGRLDKKMHQLLRPKVLVIDEVGYLPLDTVGATLLFQLVSARYERGTIILTSNKTYADWGAVFGEQTLATAILDRLLHHSITINIRGESYRLKERRKAGLFTRPEGKEAAITN